MIKFQDIRQLVDLHHAYIGRIPHPQLLSHIYTTRLDKSIHEVSIAARVADDKLLMRMEYRFFMPLSPGIAYIDKHKLKICQHLQYARDNKNPLVGAIRCRLTHGDNRSCFNCSEVVRCKFCATEFLVEHRVTKSAIYVLVWRNFGSGQRPYDPKWHKHIGIVFEPGACQNSFNSRHFSTPQALGSIRCAFELQGNNSPNTASYYQWSAINDLVLRETLMAVILRP